MLTQFDKIYIEEAEEFKSKSKPILNAKENTQEYIKMSEKVYNIRIQSAFVLTQTEIKRKLGIGYKVISTEVEKDQIIPDIKDNISAMNAIIKTGYKALARANHPDLGGSIEVMSILNRTKKELEDLLKEIV